MERAIGKKLISYCYEGAETYLRFEGDVIYMLGTDGYEESYAVRVENIDKLDCYVLRKLGLIKKG